MQPDWEQTRALVRRLRWTVIEPLARRPNGDERSRLVGPGVEFASVREYQPGDDVRRIDWNLTARLNTPYVREAQAEGALDVWLAVDVSGSVDWGTAECLKRYRAIELAAVTGQLLGRHANRLGLLLFADRPVGLIPPGQGRMHLDRLVSTLRLHPRSAARGATDLTGALEHLDRLARRPSLIVLVTDFLVPDGWVTPLRKLRRRHEVVAARLRDPREMGLPDIGLVTFEDPETGAQLTVNTGDRRLRERFAAAAAAQTSHIDAILAGCGVDELVLDTDRALLPVLAGFLEARRGRRAQRGGTPPGEPVAPEPSWRARR
jgi:uncharacterized protein (DUF58 family)